MSYDPLHQVNIESDRYLQVNNCSMQTRKDGFTVTRPEGWRDWQLLLIVNGNCIVYHGGKEHSLQPGGVILYAPGEMQKYTFPDECQSLWMHFSGTAVREILDSCSMQSGVYHLKQDLRLTELFYTVIERFNHDKTLKYVNASVIELLCAISDKIHNTGILVCPDGIRKAADYINRNYTESCDISELSRISGYSRSRFSLLFKSTWERRL